MTIRNLRWPFTERHDDGNNLVNAINAVQVSKGEQSKNAIFEGCRETEHVEEPVNSTTSTDLSA